MKRPSSSCVILPSPSLSNNLNASRNSGRRREIKRQQSTTKCSQEMLRYVPLSRDLGKNAVALGGSGFSVSLVTFLEGCDACTGCIVGVWIWVWTCSGWAWPAGPLTFCLVYGKWKHKINTKHNNGRNADVKSHDLSNWPRGQFNPRFNP